MRRSFFVAYISTESSISTSIYCTFLHLIVYCVKKDPHMANVPFQISNFVTLKSLLRINSELEYVEK